jgi:hypothetical protein
MVTCDVQSENKKWQELTFKIEILQLNLIMSHILTLALRVLNESLSTVYFYIENNNNKIFITCSKQGKFTCTYMHKIAHVPYVTKIHNNSFKVPTHCIGVCLSHMVRRIVRPCF